MQAFDYHRASSVADAAAQLAADEQAKLLAGGMTLLPTMKLRLAMPTLLVDIAGLPELRRIELAGAAHGAGAGAGAGKATAAADARGTLAVGAGVRHAEVAGDATVRAAIPALAQLAGSIGDPQVRHRGTLGGSIANNDPSADYPAALLALGATVRTDRREIAAADFFQGMFQTALEPNEIVVGVRFPVPRRAAYAKFCNPASGYAMAGVFVATVADDADVRVAVTGAGAGVFRWTEAERALATRFSVSALASLAPAADAMVSDMHGSAEYRANLTRVMATRAVASLTGEQA